MLHKGEHAWENCMCAGYCVCTNFIHMHGLIDEYICAYACIRVRDRNIRTCPPICAYACYVNMRICSGLGHSMHTHNWRRCAVPCVVATVCTIHDACVPLHLHSYVCGGACSVAASMRGMLAHRMFAHRHKALYYEYHVNACIRWSPHPILSTLAYRTGALTLRVSARSPSRC